MQTNNVTAFFPVVKPVRSHFILEMLFYYFIFVTIDLLSYYFPSWQVRDQIQHFPSFFSLFGLIVFFIIPFKKKKTKIEFDIDKKVLKYQYMTIFKKVNEKSIDLENTKTDLKTYKNTITLKIYKNKKCYFIEKENSAGFNKELLEKIHAQIKNLKKNKP